MTVKLNIEPDLRASIQEKAKADGLSVEEWIQNAIRRAATDGAPGDATLALFSEWDAADATSDHAELERRRQEFDEFRSELNANRPDQRPLFP